MSGFHLRDCLFSKHPIMNPANSFQSTHTSGHQTSQANRTVFDPVTRNGLIVRINTLCEASTRQWGKMTLYQMLKHCTLWDEMAQGKKTFKRMPLGLLFGRMSLRGLLKDGPLKKNMPTVPAFRITGDGDVPAEKANWIALIEEYASFPNLGFLHPFCGNITKEQTGILAYKHADHHLRQFGR
jgi:hypothetical protein